MIEQILANAARPSPFLPSEAPVWDDPHISSQLLDLHFDDSVVAASRSSATIAATVDRLIALVEPGAQGAGLGSGMLRHVLAKSDATGTPCYLDTGKASNVDYYRRFGFELLDERELWTGGPVLWRMQRPAEARPEA